MEKKKIVKLLLNNTELDTKDEEELIDLIIDQPLSIDVDKAQDSHMTKGDKLADKLSEVAGSWGFIILFIMFLLAWIIVNGIILKEHAFDEYPFILLNLFLSCVAAIQAPIIMMSQNRQAEKDSIRNQNDYRIDLKSELILENLHEQMEELRKEQKRIAKMLEEINDKKDK